MKKVRNQEKYKFRKKNEKKDRDVMIEERRKNREKCFFITYYGILFFRGENLKREKKKEHLSC